MQGCSITMFTAEGKVAPLRLKRVLYQHVQENKFDHFDTKNEYLEQ